jgi:hypothetical protein
MKAGYLNATDGIATPPVSIYEPNQHAIGTGPALHYQLSVECTVTGPNLNGGDSIWFVVPSSAPATAEFSPNYRVTVCLNFAIAHWRISFPSIPVRPSGRYRKPPIHITNTAHSGCLAPPIDCPTPLVSPRQFDSLVPTALANGW